MVNVKSCDHGEVVLIAGGEKCYTDIAARFCHSNRSLDDIIATPYTKKIVKNILASGHLAATEFDNYIFGITGYARVTEVQLVRKRLASYLISSGRDERNGKRAYDVVMPDNIMNIDTKVEIDPYKIMADSHPGDPLSHYQSLVDLYPDLRDTPMYINYNTMDILNILESWYNTGVDQNVPEEDLRYMKPQATEFKAIVMFNFHGLADWLCIRMCQNAQHEIRDLATKMYGECLKVNPDMFEELGPSCKRFGYCPENKRQNARCKGKIITKDEALQVLSKFKSGELIQKDDKLDSPFNKEELNEILKS